MSANKLLIVFLICAVLLNGCGKKSDAAATEITANVSNPTSAAVNLDDWQMWFTAETVDASRGDQDVVVRVFINGNPGFLTMAINIYYDSDCMSLTKLVSGSDYDEYYFVGPKNLQSGCTASWFLPELPENVVNGNIVELHFSIKESAESGSYAITIAQPRDGGVVDRDKNEITFDKAVGYINIV